MAIILMIFKVPAQPILRFYDLTFVSLNAGNDSQLPPPPVAENIISLGCRAGATEGDGVGPQEISAMGPRYCI